jgi:molybdopterin-guanine dinucleotide biosynthesis protein A
MRPACQDETTNGLERHIGLDFSETAGVAGGVRASGFVLAGGKSSRMGRDKALLPHNGTPLAGHVARQVLSAAGEVTVIGDPDRYFRLGFAVVGDLIEPCGPLGGIFTALTVSGRDWNLVAACDMPRIDPRDLIRLLKLAGQGEGGCVIPRDAGGKSHPLCAVYHRSCLPAITRAIRERRLKVTEVLGDLRPVFAPVSDPASLTNINTPEDWTNCADGH